MLRYQPSGDSSDAETAERLRVLIASRNLTFDQSWDTVLRLDETPNPGGASLNAVGKLFRGLLDTVVEKGETEHEDRLRLQHENRVHSLADALQAARFELPAGVDDLRIHVFGLGEASPPFPTKPERVLVMSPFLTDDFFRRVCPAPVDTLVSGQEALDGLSQSVLDSIPDKFVFDDGSPFEHGPADGDTEPDGDAPPTPSSSDPGKPLVGVHAKVFAIETEDRAHLFVGSANATGPAFGGNVEILAELGGSVSELGIDRLLDGDGDDPGLRELFHPYRPRPEPPPPPNGSTDLDHTRRRIARQVFQGCVKETGETGQEWAVTYRSAEPLPAIDDVEIHCWPLTTPGNRRQVGTAEPLEVRFETTLEALSGFLAFELTHDSGEQTSFAVPVPLVGVPECRKQVLLKALIGNAERFLRYLLALLYEGSDQIDLREVSTILDRSVSDGNGSFSLAVLERLLGTMRRDPLKLAGLHPLIADLRSDDALPPGFAELWDAVHQVAIKGTTEQDTRLS